MFSYGYNLHKRGEGTRVKRVRVERGTGGGGGDGGTTEKRRRGDMRDKLCMSLHYRNIKSVCNYFTRVKQGSHRPRPNTECNANVRNRSLSCRQRGVVLQALDH